MKKFIKIPLSVRLISLHDCRPLERSHWHPVNARRQLR